MAIAAVALVVLARALWTGGSNGRDDSDRSIPVVVASARIGPVIETYGAIGNASANEAVVITSKVTGLVKAINFKEGDNVAAGTVLVELDDRELKANLLAAEADVRNARQNYDRTARLAKSENAPQARVDELRAALDSAQARAEATRARLADMTIVAPFSGRLGLRRISVGTLIQQGTVITTLDDASIIKMDFSVPEKLLANVAPGQTVVARTDAFPDRHFTGTVKTVDSRIDPTTRAFEVRAEIPNGDGTLKPGMLLTLELTLAKRDAVVLIPEEALVPQGTKQYVFTVENGRARRKEVEIGTRMKGTVEIRSGLEADAVVLIGGTQRVRDGTPVRVPGQDGQGPVTSGRSQSPDKRTSPAS
ncbi:MAG: efflux RND transporter periplasmic adaptor subunit [Gemmatimonas sp.]